MRHAALLVAVVCLAVAPLAGAAGVSGGSGTAPQDGPPPQLQDETLTREGVHIGVQLQDNGDAQWNISATYELENVNDSGAFDALARSFTAGEANNGYSVDVFRAVAPEVSEQVGRPMEITGENRRATTVSGENNSTGVLTLTFTWTNFSQVTNETLVVDSFAGTWFGDLGSDQTLTIMPPEGYDPDTVEPGTSVVDGAYRWEGPQAFDVGQPSLVFTTAPPPAEPPEDSFPLAAVASVVGVVVVVGGLAVAYARGVLPTFSRRDGEGEASDEPPATTDDSPAPEPEPDASAGGSAANGGTGTAGTDESGEPAGAAGGVDPELLSDEERVERLLEANGGRMKQSKIVEETRWSTAKVSQLLSSMDDEGRIEKLRIGRENLISLPGEGVNDE
jgi:hypothetical protein